MPLPELDAKEITPFKITLLAKSSSGGCYPVTFTSRNNRIWLKCGCRAGKFGWFCKHKYHLLSGHGDWLFDPSHRSKLQNIREAIRLTGFPWLLQKYKEALIQGNEIEIKEAKKLLKKAMLKGA